MSTSPFEELAARTAQRYARRTGAPVTHLLAVALAALDRAESRYDPERGRFRPFATKELRRAVARATKVAQQ
jgi:DNA-directed RNA polymerase specialized sigma subunit